MSDSEQMKIVIVGEADIGKSSILLRYIADTYSDESNPTLGVAYLSKTITFGGIGIKMNIWDTAGQERFGSLTKIYSRDANAILLVYDITSRSSFEKMKSIYINLQNEKFDEEVIFAVVANKEDLCNQEQVTIEEAKDFANSIGAIYKKTSAKLNIGIEELFDALGQRYLSKNSCFIRDTIVLSRDEREYKVKKCCK